MLYFFTNPSKNEWSRDDRGREFWFPKIMRPDLVVGYLTKLFVEFSDLAKTISLEQLDAGLDGMFNAAYFELQSVLWNPAVPLDARIHCVQSMYAVFSDFVVGCGAEVLPGSFYMWWDHICTAFWFRQARNRDSETVTYAELNEDDQRLVDAMFETLRRILLLNDDKAKDAALHGLGHLHHPGVHDVVQQFIDSLPNEANSTETMAWLAKCRDGIVM